jgi:hypothetical protein
MIEEYKKVFGKAPNAKELEEFLNIRAVDHDKKILSTIK